METTIICPVCGEKLSICCYVESSTSKVKTRIYQAIQKFLMWNMFGKPEYGKQYKYNPDHEYVKFEVENKERMIGYFRFKIQVFGSPEGDEWLEGKVKVRGSKIDWKTLEFKYVGI